ncbi:hypothetical protein L226DRAFT_309971 [Lentinus tigrinus ALCF2SS1-7]|uniref:Uncharacterized protein n=1 Tax=Lentinus tigrinus ALCF2SS1-6 TaxID=1328759 RepID=A0A5C2S4X3_9APHY|nr:hypothetical protein L227DRAFT_176409 [Lentinus tigrinus ALCF2SS1-6]RPD68912.1 hypothetical protein L226DRAFT_309971 [Lentinus tigrinus ALCF2SS1-7]
MMSQPVEHTRSSTAASEGSEKQRSPCLWRVLVRRASDATGIVATPSPSILRSPSSSSISETRKQSHGGATNSEGSPHTQTKERGASEAENRQRARPQPTKAVAQDSPATPNPHLSRKDRRVVQDMLWKIARKLHQTVPRSPPTTGNNPVKLKSCLELPHFLWVWRCKSDGESGNTAPQLYLRTLPLRHGDLRVESWWQSCRYRVAHLQMSSEPAGSEGNHSATCRATFTFDEAKNSHWWHRDRTTSAIVIAKTARPPPTDSDKGADKGAKRRFLKAFLEDVQMLGNEAKIYDVFPAALMGYKEARSHAGVWSKPRTKLVDDPDSALVPKFYGYYTPYEPPATLTTGLHGLKTGKKGGQQRYKAEIRSPILLIEDCGNEIKTYGLTKRDRCVA